jgi:hypothetical protein
MPESFFHLSAKEQEEALQVAASASGRPAHLLEKDIWVVWALSTLFASPLGSHLVFKGGTALSKAYKAIRRFSEDVDLTYDIRALAPQLVGNAPDGLDAIPPSRSQEKKWSDEIRKELLPAWLRDSAHRCFNCWLVRTRREPISALFATPRVHGIRCLSKRPVFPTGIFIGLGLTMWSCIRQRELHIAFADFVRLQRSGRS